MRNQKDFEKEEKDRQITCYRLYLFLSLRNIEKEGLRKGWDLD
ncbi:hypothetical protein NEOC65_000438 [Neochlamydia sp. AcF65]|nr:hypothetical protein [Neochlamydia sp. AcF65]